LRIMEDIKYSLDGLHNSLVSFTFMHNLILK